MKLKLDENLGHTPANLLRRAGHDVSTVYDQNLCSASDRQIASVCRSEGRCLVTLDLGFSNPLVYDPHSYAGIVVMRLPDNPGLQDIQEAIQTLIAGLIREDVSRKLWIVRRRRIREYRPD